MFKLMEFLSKDNNNNSNNIIKINCSTDKNGYIKFQIKNANNENINGFTYDDSDNIGEYINDFNKLLTWNTKSIIPINKFYIEVEGYNFKIFSITII
jgi:hypothetical protein